MLNLDDESLCRMCFDKQAQPNSLFCSACDRRPTALRLDASSTKKDDSLVTICDEEGNVIYEADLRAGTNVHAAAQDMHNALKSKGYPPIKLSFFERKSEE